VFKVVSGRGKKNPPMNRRSFRWAQLWKTNKTSNAKI